MVDPIGDMFARIKNAQRSKKTEVAIPHSKVKMEIAKLLSDKGFVGEVARRGKRNRRSIEISLIYDSLTNDARIVEIGRVSKPSKRVYLGYKDIRLKKGGMGFYIVSTSKGMMDDQKARKLKMGGEIIGEVY